MSEPAEHEVATTTAPAYPPGQRVDVVDILHGVEIPDPYRWLEEPATEQTQAWAQAQDELYERYRSTWAGVEHFTERLRTLLSGGVVGVPVWRGSRRFFIRREGGQEHGVLFVSEPDDTPGCAEGARVERALIDPIAVDPTGTTTLDAWQPSVEGDLLAYQLSEGGTEESVLRVLDVATGQVVDGPIDRARYSPIAWLPGGEAYFYVRRVHPATVPQAERQYHRRVWLHRLGTDADDDVEIFGAGLDLHNYYGVSVNRTGRWLAISAATGTAPRNDVWLADLTASPPQTPALREVVSGLDARTGVAVGRDGRLYVATDLDAPRGRLAVADPLTPAPEHWRDLLAQHEEAVLEDYTVLDGAALGEQKLMLASWTRHAVSEITVHLLGTGEQLSGDLGRIELHGVGTVGALLSRPEGGHEAWFTFTDQTTPPHVYRFDARIHLGLAGADGEPAVGVDAAPPGAVEVPDVVTHQVAYDSADGTTVRMFLTARADAFDTAGEPVQPMPTILYGYGGFGVALNPGYSAGILAWAEAGGLYAVANLRGGAEEGEEWHRAGMMADKQNVYDDFHAAAEHLVARGWTTPQQLSISGGSNGGLLVGVALTQRPDLYACVVCSAPLLDMIRYEQFGLGATWNEEYGTVADAEQLGWLLAYSPYHHVREHEAYPAVLFTVFDSDTRVDPLHARKMCAALQHATSSPAPVLIRREKDVGHGARALSRTVALSSETLAFQAAQTGLAL